MKITEKNIEVGTKDAYMFVFIIYYIYMYNFTNVKISIKLQ